MLIKYRFKATTLAVLILFQLSLLDMPLGRRELGPGTALAESAPLLPSFADLAASEKKSVVNISTTKVIRGRRSLPFPFDMPPGGRGHGNENEDSMREFFGDDLFKHFFGEQGQGRSPRQSFKETSLGSGFIISQDGYILTNFHVVDGADEIQVKLSTEKSYPAKVVGKDKKLDIALIKIDTEQDLPVAPLGDSDKMRVGDWVMAIGNPFGLEHTVTVGIVSAKGRVIGAGPYDDFIQTDASINPGNSGGPVFNLNGEVIGISTAIVAGGQGIGFAIPVNAVKEIIPQLKETGRVTRGWLGISIQGVTADLSKALGLEGEGGALVAEVIKGSPAEAAGIERGDVIVKFDDQEVKDEAHLSRLAAATKVGKKVDIQLIRNGKPKEVTVKAGQYPEDEAEMEAGEQSPQPEVHEKMGLSVQNLTPELRESLDLERGLKGVLVTKVEPGSIADKASPSLRRGDVIIEVNQAPINNVDDLKEQINKAKSGQNMLILIRRGKSTLFTSLKKE